MLRILEMPASHLRVVDTPLRRRHSLRWWRFRLGLGAPSIISCAAHPRGPSGSMREGAADSGPLLPTLGPTRVLSERRRPLLGSPRRIYLSLLTEPGGLLCL